MPSMLSIIAVTSWLWINSCHAVTCSLHVYCSWNTSYWMFVDMSVFITIKTSISCVVLWCMHSNKTMHNKYAHIKTDVLFTYCYSACRMVGHHCIIVQKMVTRTFVTNCWIQKELMWMLSIRWVHDWLQIFIRTEIITEKVSTNILHLLIFGFFFW